MGLLLEDIEPKPQINRNVVTNLVIVTDSEELFRLARLKPPTAIYIKRSMPDIHTIFSYLSFSYVVIVSLEDLGLITDVILPACATYIIQMEPQELYIALYKDLPNLDEVYQEAKDYVKSNPLAPIENTRKHTSKTYADYSNTFFARYLSEMATNFYPIIQHKLITSPHYDEDIDKWVSYFEILLSDKYKKDDWFKEVINNINYKRYITGSQFLFFRPLLLYVMWLMNSIGELLDTISERTIEFLCNVSYYLYTRKGLRDGI
jgi:hypothetical protein